MSDQSETRRAGYTPQKQELEEIPAATFREGGSVQRPGFPVRPPGKLPGGEDISDKAREQ
jgi:hypothetical protein